MSRWILGTLLCAALGCHAGMGGDGGSTATGDPDAGPQGCEPYASLTCTGESLYWVDSCGKVGELAEECSTELVCNGVYQACCPAGATDSSQCNATPEPPAEEPPAEDPPEPPARCDDRFSDVPSGSLGDDEIHALYINEVVNGCSPDPLSFCPEDDASRLQTAIMLIKAMDERPSTAADDAYFCDVSGPFAGYANRLYELGITNGCITDTPCADSAKKTFCPSDPTRRDHMAVFLVRALGENESNAADDAYFDDATPLFAGYINRLYELGITLGCAPNQYCSLDSTVRNHAAIFLARAFDLDDAVCTP